MIGNATPRRPQSHCFCSSPGSWIDGAMDPSASLSDNRRHMTPGCYQKRNDLPIKKALPSSPPSRPCGYVSLCAFCSFALHRWRVLLLQPFPPLCPPFLPVYALALPAGCLFRRETPSTSLGAMRYFFFFLSLLSLSSTPC